VGGVRKGFVQRDGFYQSALPMLETPTPSGKIDEEFMR